VNSTVLITDPLFKNHLTGAGHPECPARCEVIVQALSSLKIPMLCPRDAKKEDILLCHTAAYFDIVKHNVLESKSVGIIGSSFSLSTGDTPICPESLKVALHAAGAVLTGIDAVISKQFKRAFCIIRPPGHHACSNQGMGFCIFNNIAVGARYAQKKYGVSKVLIIDWDVHHGNGTQQIFESDPSIFYFSTHQWPLYPGTGKAEEVGKGSGIGTTLNCPISPGENSRIQVLEAFRQKLIPTMERFQPDLVMISAGFDGHYSDPLGGFNLTNDDFGELTRISRQLAENYANGMIISVLEGGYNLQGIAEAAKAHVLALEK
jgi:acetoin utilization deacetylase AcuC-like enzyme